MKLPHLQDILETQRYILKIPEESEAEKMWNMISENTTRYMIWDKGESYETTLKNIISARKSAFEGESWDAAIYDKQNEELLGRCGVNGIRKDIPKFQVGYWIAEKYYGNGIVSECVRSLTKYMFETGGFEKGVIRCDSENLASVRVAEKSGFIFEGESKYCERNHGVLKDTKFFGITKNDYFSQK